ncbi:hypothetical protein RGI145_12445 [Roseomonas gilardii]|uniref:Uncharacterized protein n=1 Tax=Roseomonas gilardii TaxID=257708 RepID=A0A1L7AGB7_9PROT|nr:hypothetical protein [Roseomonas gilardii]APT57802.1 hypothetical protein RGI145_12445 [Roseomonas gilardii]
MTTPEPFGTLHTPYGIEVEVHRNPDAREDDEDSFAVGLEACALMGGIHDPAKRRAFIEAAGKAAREHGGMPLDFISEFGGQKVPRRSIIPAVAPVYSTMPTDRDGPFSNRDGFSVRDCADAIANDLLDRRRWYERSEYLMGFLGNQLPVLGNMPKALGGLALGLIIAGVLELLGETEIDCLEQAAFYALAEHQPWRDAGRSWLLPHRKTWVADWIEKRPDYRRAARLVSHVHPDVPSWLGSVTR